MLRRQLQIDRLRCAAFTALFGIPAFAILVFQLFVVFPGNTPAYVLAGLLASLSAILATRAVRLWLWPNRHWIGKCLQQIDPQSWELAKVIDDEWRADGALVEGTVPQFGSWWQPIVWFTVLTPNWLIHVSKSRIVILMPDRIAWVYRKITADPRTFALSRFHHAVSCRMGAATAEFDIRTRTEMIAQWLAAELVRHTPHVLAGYQGDWIELNRTNPILLVMRRDQRRSEFEALPRAEQALWVEESIEDLDEFPRRVDPYAPETLAEPKPN